MKKINHYVAALVSAKTFALAGLCFAATSAFGGDLGWELRRVVVSERSSTVYTCHIRPGVIENQTEFGGLGGVQSTVFSTDNDAVMALVCAAPGIAIPYGHDDHAPHTDWWARASSDQAFKLIRTNNGKGEIVQDESDAGQRLAVFLGANCPQFFGE